MKGHHKTHEISDGPGPCTLTACYLVMILKPDSNRCSSHSVEELNMKKFQLVQDQQLTQIWRICIKNLQRWRIFVVS